MMRLAFTMDVR